MIFVIIYFLLNNSSFNPLNNCMELILIEERSTRRAVIASYPIKWAQASRSKYNLLIKPFHIVSTDQPNKLNHNENLHKTQRLFVGRLQWKHAIEPYKVYKKPRPSHQLNTTQSLWAIAELSSNHHPDMIMTVDNEYIMDMPIILWNSHWAKGDTELIRHPTHTNKCKTRFFPIIYRTE
jgi:hypothetical protein